MRCLLCLSLSLNLLPLFAELLADEGVLQFPLEILTTLAVEIPQKPATLQTESPLTRLK